MNIKIKMEDPAPTRADILLVEKNLGIKLNRQFVDFVCRFNGGTPESNIFKISEDNDSSIRKFIELNDIPREASFFREEVGKYIIPIAYDDFGNYVCISNEQNDGAIYFWEHEYPEGEALIELAPSLARFLDMVHPFDKSQITLKPGQVKSVWVSSEFLKK
jgi:hypothetical protein